MNGIIYVATCTVNGKVYVGQTIRSLDKRRIGHCSSKSKWPFHNAIRKHGAEQFTWKILHSDVKTMEELNRLEISAIAAFDSMNTERGYNCMSGGGQGGAASDATRAKMSAAAVGKVLSEDTRKKLSDAGRGRVATPETRKKLSDYAKNRPPDYYANLGAIHTGKFVSAETRAKQSASHKGRVASRNPTKTECRAYWTNPICRDTCETEFSRKESLSRTQSEAECIVYWQSSI